AVHEWIPCVSENQTVGPCLDTNLQKSSSSYTMRQVVVVFISWRIVTTLGERMTTANPPRAFPGAAKRAVLPYRKDEILRAAGLEPADRWEDGAQANLIEAHTRNEKRGEAAAEPGQGFDSHGRPASALNLRPNCLTRRGSERFRSSKVGSSV